MNGIKFITPVLNRLGRDIKSLPQRIVCSALCRIAQVFVSGLVKSRQVVTADHAKDAISIHVEAR